MPASSDPTSLHLLRRAKRGDREALDELFARHLPLLQRWARGRLPRWSRGVAETTDLVQDAVFNAFRRLSAFEPKREGALQAYLRESIRNRVRDELRLAGRRGDPETMVDDDVMDAQPSPLDQVLERDTAQRYAAALARLPEGDRDLIVGRLELEYSYEQLAVATGRRGAEAARVAVRRALLHLADEMDRV